ncbi:hypothetical protein GF1_24200 [Desulfolithobacter dissulfuricans]|uniref:NAD-dependent epimerase/dehydratase domain-containing protein n=1 Tax=Desulfolithobacter dissulfuricans TaxID=2795293 RepID=A0A915U2J7_9BACT|nr:NAD-dependent epimerase/dehydratase family protein [Desulfolithobacter dissulfuricans]BCO10044.1 hypothetical protein GF1_24200 [Desulfolithobacter dissulfuricans]
MAYCAPSSAGPFGIIVGGSGLVGGSIVYHFKKWGYDILAPNSKKMSLANPDDIASYFNKYRPDFIINTAIAAIDANPKLAFDVNYVGSINLAKVAMALKIPYIFFSSAAVLPPGLNLREEDHLPLSADITNYAKSKLMSEMTLRHLGENEGLDYTTIRLAIVYGKHDHKIQGFHRMLFAIADQSMPVLLTRPRVYHSYSNTRKIPHFVRHVLSNREEFSGQTFHFADPNPVELAQLILTIRSYLELKSPREVYLPLPMARFGATCIQHLIRFLAKIGIKTRMPPELMFLENFYQSQTLSCEKLQRSSFQDPFPEETVFTRLPDLIQYYLTRWEQLNLMTSKTQDFFDPQKLSEEFLRNPAQLLEAIHERKLSPFMEPRFNPSCGVRKSAATRSHHC